MRKIVYSVIIVAAAIVAFASYRLATRTIVIGRASLGGPPPTTNPMSQVRDLVGDPMPAFDAVDITGSRVNSSAHRGQVILVDVWATWCRPCRDELPRIENEIWRKHRGRVAVVAFARDDTEWAVRHFNQQAGLTFPLVADPRRRWTDLFGGSGPIPRVYLIGRSGHFVHQSIGYTPLRFGELVHAVEEELAR